MHLVPSSAPLKHGSHQCCTVRRNKKPGIALLPGKQEVDAAHDSKPRRELLLKDHTHRMCTITPDKIKSGARKTKGKTKGAFFNL